MASSKASTADEMQAVIKKGTNKCSIEDQTWQLETKLLSLICGQGAQARMQKQLMDLMPSVEKNVPSATIARLMAQMMIGDAWRMTSRPVHIQWTHVSNLIKSIVSEVPPDVCAAQENTDLAPIIARFQFFVTHQEDGSTLFGSVALSAQFAHAKISLMKGKATPEMVTDISVFRWLLPADIKVQALTLMKKIRDSGAMSA